MNEVDARKILVGMIRSDNSLYCLGKYLSWDGSTEAILDGEFTHLELVAIGWWMLNMEIIK
jgi:hypothetical protein